MDLWARPPRGGAADHVGGCSAAHRTIRTARADSGRVLGVCAGVLYLRDWAGNSRAARPVRHVRVGPPLGRQTLVAIPDTEEGRRAWTLKDLREVVRTQGG